MELPDNCEYFDKKMPNIFDRLIKEQGNDVCQNMLHDNYIRNQVVDYTFGFAYIGQKTRSKKQERRLTDAEEDEDFCSIGGILRKTSECESEAKLSSFVLCKIENELQYIDITLICSRKNTKQGKILMGVVEQYARILKIPYLHLDSLAEQKLLDWYKSQGFVIFKNKMHVSGDIKAHTMIKFLN